MKAMREISSSLVAVVLVMASVFLPTAFCPVSPAGHWVPDFS